METYKVIWEIDIDADSPEEAAQEALKIQRDPNSGASHFRVAPDPFTYPDVDWHEVWAGE